MPKTRLLLLLLVALPLLAPPAAAQGVSRRLIAHWVTEFHLEDAGVDEEALLRGAAARSAEGQDAEAVRQWAWSELWRQTWGFAPEGAIHDDEARYRLPYPLKIPRLCAQSFDGEFPEWANAEPTHVGSDRYAIDFELPMRTEILAARPGTVALVLDGFTGRDIEDESSRHRQNTVAVLHEDGTYAAYTHLSPGIPVRRGQAVKRGETLGRSGDTGYANAPHLHFAVYHRVAGRAESVPIRFGVGSPEGYVPKAGQHYGAPPRPNRKLRVRVDGREVDQEALTPIQRGASAQLQVELIGPRGVRDVTRSPFLEYASLHLRGMDVERRGRVHARPAEGFEEIPFDVGVVSLFYVDGRREVALGKVVFHIQEPPSGATAVP